MAAQDRQRDGLGSLGLRNRTLPEEIQALLRRLDAIERNQSDAAKTASAVIEEIHGVKTDRAVRTERDLRLNERLERIEERLDGVYKIGWWFLALFGAAFISLVASFTFRGGFFNVLP